VHRDWFGAQKGDRCKRKHEGRQFLRVHDS
jgi:hypothetical protein